MKVLVDGTGAGSLGIQRVLVQVVRNWDPADELLILPSTGALGWSVSQAHVGGARKSLLVVSATVSLLRLRSSQQPPDVVWSASPSPLVSASRGVPVVTLFHDFLFRAHPELVTPMQRRYRSLVYPRALLRSAAVLAVSRKTAQEACTYYPHVGTGLTPRVRPRSGELAVPESAVLPREVDRQGERQRLILVTAHAPSKRALCAVRAAPHLPSDVKFVLLCGSRERASKMAQEIQRMGMDGRTVCLPALSDSMYATLLHRADVAVILSEYEGFGLPVAEALYAGIPTVISAEPAMQEVSAGFAHIAGDLSPRAVAEAIRKALEEGRVVGWPYGARTWRAVASDLRQVLLDASGR